MRKIRIRSVTSNKPIAEAMTTAAKAAAGRCRSRFGTTNNSRATTTAPMTPVNCVRAPAASATGVREELLLIGKPEKIQQPNWRRQVRPSPDQDRRVYRFGQHKRARERWCRRRIRLRLRILLSEPEQYQHR